MRLQELVEAPITDYVPLGDFEKAGPFRGADRKLAPHPTNELRARRMFENTPYDFRLFFSNIPGTGKYSERGTMSEEEIREIFGDQADQIIKGSDDAITVVFVGNQGVDKVPLTPWVMAHRFGHAIQADRRGDIVSWTPWTEVEEYFFNTVNHILEEYYGKRSTKYHNMPVKWDISSEYNALFNAIGTQRSSRNKQIKRPYEFLYELFAQYLLTGRVTLNALPLQLAYGRQAWGRPTRYLNLKPQYRDEDQRSLATDKITQELGSYFDGVLGAAVGNIYVM